MFIVNQRKKHFSVSHNEKFAKWFKNSNFLSLGKMHGRYTKWKVGMKIISRTSLCIWQCSIFLHVSSTTFNIYSINVKNIFYILKHQIGKSPASLQMSFIFEMDLF